MYDDLKKDYGKICEAAPEFAEIASLDDFMKMYSLVSSRVFGTTVNDEENESVVPYAGMAPSANWSFQTCSTSSMEAA